MTALIRIIAPHFVAGVVLGETGRVIRCAPILHYMRNWPLASVLAYVDARAEKRWSSEQMA